jgi:hypothetical protein
MRHLALACWGLEILDYLSSFSVERKVGSLKAAVSTSVLLFNISGNLGFLSVGSKNVPLQVAVNY